MSVLSDRTIKEEIASGRLKIEGDMMFAASAVSLFTIPKG